jgi:hypothetical protein
MIAYCTREDVKSALDSASARPRPARSITLLSLLAVSRLMAHDLADCVGLAVRGSVQLGVIGPGVGVISWG